MSGMVTPRKPRHLWGPVGRPTKFKPEFVAVAKQMAYLGATDRDLAIAFNVCIDEIKYWKARYPKFSAA